jgi:hypothetical protein
MVDAYRLPADLKRNLPSEGPGADRALKDFRYVVASVNDEALKVWADLWKELQGGVTPAGLVGPELQEGFKPSCGWPEFLERVWLLKHYLDYIHRFCNETTET